MIIDPPAMPVISNQFLSTTEGSDDSIGNMTVTIIEWISSDAIIIDSYIITVSPPIALMSTFITYNTSIELPILYNQEYNISLVAKNCAGNSTPAEASLRIG